MTDAVAAFRPCPSPGAGSAVTGPERAWQDSVTKTQARTRDRRPLLPTSWREELRRAGRVLAGVAVIAVAGAMGAALLSYSPSDPGFNQATTAAARNWLGLPGAWIASLLLETLGLAAAILPLVLLGWGLVIVRGARRRVVLGRLALLPVAISLVALGCAFLAPGEELMQRVLWGGLLGAVLRSVLLGGWHASALGVPDELWAAGILPAGLVLAVLAAGGRIRHLWMLPRAAARLLRRVLSRLGPMAKRAPSRSAATRRRPASGTVARKTGKPAISAPRTATRGERLARERQASLFADAGFQLPPLDLLAEPPAADPAHRLSREALEQNARLLESVLEEYGISGRIREIRPGPVVTLYELEPAPGTKSARVIALADDIARSMSAISARIAVVPGRNAIGIELPNARREPVFLREILASRAYERSGFKLPLALGKDIAGDPVIVDLATMPHLLVAGTTGSGKSVGLNAMILSLLYRLTPEECRMIMVDPKMLELSIYEGIPHLLIPVVTEPKKAVVALKWAVHEMEERYRAMAKLGVRNLAAFNKRVADAQRAGKPLTRKVQVGFDPETGEPVFETQEFELEPLPMIVVVIDEMADLMLVAGKEVEASVQRLAQMARAAGIHLIMATQRPSVDVITGTIKANFPTRISFQVTSKIDSRTILGEQGAEQLLGRGDMLFMAAGGRITRIHGAYVSETEVEQVAGFLRRQRPPQYRSEVLEEPQEGSGSPVLDAALASGSGAREDEDLLKRAIAIVLKDRRVSTSYIQRRLRIGYNRAASLIEEMEERGIISAPNPQGRREVLIEEMPE